MAKKTISLALDDSLIEYVDQLSIQSGKSRSEIVNTALSETLLIQNIKYTMGNVLAVVHEYVEKQKGFQVMSHVRGSTLQFRQSVVYRYNPKIKYTLSLLGNKEGEYLRMTIQTRTTSKDFLQHLMLFFTELDHIEDEYSQQAKELQSPFYFKKDRFEKIFYCKEDWVEFESTCRYINAYIAFIQESLTIYFNDLGNWRLTHELVSRNYQTLINKYTKV